MGGLDVVVFAQALVTDDVGHVGGVPGNGIVAVAADPQGGQPLQEGVRRRLAGVPGQHHAAHVEAHAPEDVDEAQHVVVVGDTQVAPDLALFDVGGIDGNDDLHIVLKLLEHADFAVRLKARQHPGGVIVVEELAAELQIQLAAELGNALPDMGGLHLQIFLIVKPDACHGC